MLDKNYIKIKTLTGYTKDDVILDENIQDIESLDYLKNLGLIEYKTINEFTDPDDEDNIINKEYLERFGRPTKNAKTFYFEYNGKMYSHKYSALLLYLVEWNTPVFTDTELDETYDIKNGNKAVIIKKEHGYIKLTNMSKENLAFTQTLYEIGVIEYYYEIGE